jgi:hypothetical protein
MNVQGENERQQYDEVRSDESHLSKIGHVLGSVILKLGRCAFH